MGFLKYSVVGGLNTLTDFLVFIALIELFSSSLVFAQCSAFSFAVLQSYLINSRWTFHKVASRQGNLRLKQAFEFACVQLFVLVVSIQVLTVASDVVGLYPAKLITVGVSAILGYVLCKYFVYRLRTSARPQ
jgi:putative flippase GtrA